MALSFRRCICFPLWVILLVLGINKLQGQTCATAIPICPIGISQTLNGGLNIVDGSFFDCIPLTNLSPKFTLLQIGQAGNLTIDINTPGSVDVDWIVWGPFNSIASAHSSCSLLGLAGNGTVIVCNNATGNDGTFTLNSVTVGQVYVLMVSKDVLGILSTPVVTITQNSSSTASLAPGFSTSVTNLTCNGSGNGTITVNATGNGTLEYSKNGGTNYQLSNTFSLLASGSYDIRVRDSYCESNIVNVTVTQPTLLSQTISPVVNATACPGNGSITITDSGGTSPYQFSIDGGSNYFSGSNPYVFNGLIAATYNVIVKDANNCTTSSTPVTLTGPVIPSLTINSVIQPTCTNGNNGFISFSGNGGMTPYTYSINNGINYFAGSNPYAASNLIPGTYQLKVKAASGCESITTIQLLTGQHPPPNGSINGNTICAGQQGQLTFTSSIGTGPYNLLINSNNYTGIISGVPFNVIPNPTVTTNYILTQIIDSNGCITN